jgi:hypothetical protein
VHALGLGQEPLALTALAKALGQGDFSGLPTVELIADDELPGARSHFSDSSQTVFLNTLWLADSDQDAVLHELTVRWGEHLDTLLNTSDTPGDEGSQFAALRPCSALAEQLLPCERLGGGTSLGTGMKRAAGIAGAAGAGRGNKKHGKLNRYGSRTKRLPFPQREFTRSNR